ncbi:MAG TPA: cupin domain-containing protein [Pedococcus sp.]|jgi:uncharacterized RmlC-like cupin family protein|uniref:cupin domain-containing protein n=1 Tax=Pedococcus sp. TaxID=2860345 RepID=UPI002F95442F
MGDDDQVVDNGQRVWRVTPSERTEGQPTPGMLREQAVSTEGMWAGYVTTGPGMVSGWHHHGDHESSIYVMSGALHMEFGPGGDRALDAAPGDFVYVAPHAIHREGNPTDVESTLIVVRAGSGEAVFNVDGPAAR